MAKRTRSWNLALAASLALAQAGCGAGTEETVRPSAPERTPVQAAALSGTVTRSQVLSNAEQWVTAQLQYCQSANGKPDGDTACSPVCMRTSNAQWDPYRSDCSGFISWAWELPAPGLVTDEFAPYDTTASTTINCADMLPGDAANRDPNVGHIVLFEQWITPGQEALFLEEPGCSSSIPYAHEFQSAVTCTGSTVDISYEGDTFTAIRYVNIVDDPATGSSSSAGSSSTSVTSSESSSSTATRASTTGRGSSSSGSSHATTSQTMRGSVSSSGAIGSGSSGATSQSTTAGGTAPQAEIKAHGGCGASPGSAAPGSLALLALLGMGSRRRRASR